MGKCVGYPIRRGGCEAEATNPPRHPLWCDLHEGVRRGAISKDLADIAESMRVKTADARFSHQETKEK